MMDAFANVHVWRRCFPKDLFLRSQGGLPTTIEKTSSMFLRVKKHGVALPEIIEKNLVGWRQEGGMEEREKGGRQRLD